MSQTTDMDEDIRNLKGRLSITTSPIGAEPSTTDDDEYLILASSDSQELTEQYEALSPSLSSIPLSSSSSSSLRHNPRRANDRLTSIARTAVRATKEQFWDSNEPGIIAAQTAVNRWEEIYVWFRNTVVATSRSAAGVYNASKTGARGLDQGLLVPVRDFVLMPTFSVAEYIVNGTSSFIYSSEAERLRRIVAEGSSEFVSKVVPFGLGETVVLPAVRLSSNTVQNVWNIARYPVPSQQQVRNTVDFLLNGSKKNLSICGREIIWYFRRADATISRSLHRTQWVILGSGPYETLNSEGRRDVMDHVCERYLSIGKVGDIEYDDSDNHSNVMVARYEFMANVRACNRSLYCDLVHTGLLKKRGGASTIDHEWLSERPQYRSRSKDVFLLDEHFDKDESRDVFALWFRFPSEGGKRPKKEVPWILFDPKEGKMLEEKYRSILKKSNASGRISSEGSPQGSKSPPKKGPIWDSPKYATNAKWYNPDLDRDLLLDQKRHAVTFVCRSPEHHLCGRDRNTFDQNQNEVHFDSPRSQQQRKKLDENYNEISCHLWEADRLFALPPPILGLYRPTMWRFYCPDEVCRAVWFLDTPRNGPQPYAEDDQSLLEDAYQFLKWKIGLKSKVNKSSTEDVREDIGKGRDYGNNNVLLTVQVSSPDSSEQQLVQFKSLTLATAVKKGIGGAISPFKQRVYRGAYNCISRDETDASMNMCVEDEEPTQINEDSGWTTTTEEALEKLRLTISTKDAVKNDEKGEEIINIKYKECFDDLEKDQIFLESDDFALSQNGTQSSSHVKNRQCDDMPSLAFKMAYAPNNLVQLYDDGLEVDHLILVVHGIGEMMKTFDFFGLKKVPTIVDCCGYLRDNHSVVLDAHSAKICQATLNINQTTKQSGRVEYLPIEWHEAFSIQSTRRAVTKPIPSCKNKYPSSVRVDDISLRTIPTLRSFANDTLMDILYFMSPAHHDIIVDIVSFELDFVVKRFRKLTGFKGDISIIGHSIGSVIAWDILDNQENSDLLSQSSMTPKNCVLKNVDDSYRYPQLSFVVDTVYLLGSPVPVFLMIRNQEKPLTTTFKLNGCPRVFNIFHPYDPVSYRLEPLLHPKNSDIEPDIILHWNGGFRFQYQTKRLWKTIVHETLRAEENVLHSLESCIESLGLVASSSNNCDTCEFGISNASDQDASHVLITGSLNGGRRIDYMLQEKEIDRANEYVAALAAHSCYWVEKDLSIFIANEISCAKKRKHGGHNTL